MKAHLTSRLVLLAVACSLSATSFAQGLERREHPGMRSGVEMTHVRPVYAHLDDRFGHAHYYPAHGAIVPVLPSGALHLAVGANHWYFYGGVWFRPVGMRYVVDLPPLGIVVPILPPAFVTLHIGGLDYYYANDVYYAAAPGGYVVVAAPSGAPSAQPQPAPVSPTPVAAADPVVYPRDGQSPAQLQSDLQACKSWAVNQPGAGTDISILQRATGACLDGRGYTVR